MGGQASAISLERLDGRGDDAPSVGRRSRVNWPSLRRAAAASASRRSRGARGRSARSRRSTTSRSARSRTGSNGRAAISRSRDKAAASRIDRDLKLEALGPVVRGELPLLVNADDDRDIKNAIEFCEKHKLKLIIARRRGLVQDRRPAREEGRAGDPRSGAGAARATTSRTTRRNTTPGVLQKAGVKFALASFNSSDSRQSPVRNRQRRVATACRARRR